MKQVVNKNHGSPFDRGGADSYYGRQYDPHWWPEGTLKGEKVHMKDMTKKQILEYSKGWDANETAGIFKDWG